jgi:hypothetical protein
MKRIDSAEEIYAVVQPNSFCSGTMKTPGAPTVPALISAVRKGHADHHPAVVDVAAGEGGRQPVGDHDFSCPELPAMTE